ncbi:MAG: MFS transporter [Treponema sp.]|jgi:Na+/melibiose symporter-like transporter|nr:MFS transporter [Treponema sp.]
MSTPLSPYRLSKARDLYNIFNVFNAFSYTVLAGGIITLFAMRLRANSTFIGLLSAVAYSAFFFLPVGKILTKTFSVIQIYSITWILRAVAMAPLLFVPLLEARGHSEIGLNLVLIGTLAFHMSRGIGMIGNNPVLNDLAVGPDRASYMTQIQVINSAIGMVSNFAIALLLGSNPPLVIYAIIISIGIVGGVISGLMLKKLPEPHGDTDKKETVFVNALKECFSRASFKEFIVLLILIAMASGVARAFLIVYCREIFDQSDGMVALYTVFGGLGSLLIGMVIKFLIDMVGAKPLFVWCTIIGLVSLLPIVFLPFGTVNGNIITLLLFLSFLNFIINFGFIGAEGLAQTYFLALIPAKYMLDMGIVYYFCFGIAGAGGSFLAGLFLDICTGAGVSGFNAFKILYAVLAVMTVVVLVLQRGLVRLGALPFKGATEVMFSFRDLRAITILERLNKTSDSQEEETLLEALHDSPSQLAINGLLERSQSPLLSVRFEAIRALETLDTLNPDAEKALIMDSINSSFMTAYISARILGKKQVSAAISVLRELAFSTDYMLAAETVIALAKLNDEAFRPQVEEIVLNTQNPRLKIMGVEALGIYHASASIVPLFNILITNKGSPYLENEIILALSNILNTRNQFYPIFVRFLDEPSLEVTLALDEAESAVEWYRATHGRWNPFRKKAMFVRISEQTKTLVSAISAFLNDSNPTLFSQWIVSIPSEECNVAVQWIFSETVLDENLAHIPKLRLLICHWAAHTLRVWTQRLAKPNHKNPKALPPSEKSIGL